MVTEVLSRKAPNFKLEANTRFDGSKLDLLKSLCLEVDKEVKALDFLKAPTLINNYSTSARWI